MIWCFERGRYDLRLSDTFELWGKVHMDVEARRFCLPGFTCFCFLVLLPHLSLFAVTPVTLFQDGRPPTYSIVMAGFLETQRSSSCLDTYTKVDAQLRDRDTEPNSNRHRLVARNVSFNLDHQCIVD
jgi:hypothetical protein